jgi:hypothetical protein
MAGELGITGTDNDEVEEVVEGSTALETLLMHRTISSTTTTDLREKVGFSRGLLG